MNTPVSFEIAKFLKEKECDIRVRHYYGSSVNPHIPYAKDDYEIPINYNNPTNSGTIKQLISAPTIAEVVMWLHKEKGLWVNVMYMGFELKYTWSIDIITTSGSDWDSYGEEGDICYKSPTEAYEAAIIYTLKNLI